MTDTMFNTSLDTVYLVDDSDHDVILEVVIGASRPGYGYFHHVAWTA